MRAANRTHRVRLARGPERRTTATWCVAVITSCSAAPISPLDLLPCRRAVRRCNTRRGSLRPWVCVLRALRPAAVVSAARGVSGPSISDWIVHTAVRSRA